MECGRAWFHRLVRHLERRSGPLWFLGLRKLSFAFRRSLLRDPRELTASYAVLGVAGGISALVFSKALGYLRPRLAIAGALDPLLSTGVGRIARWEPSASSGFPQVMGPRVWGNGSGHAWPIRVAVAGRSRAVQNSGDYIIVYRAAHPAACSRLRFLSERCSAQPWAPLKSTTFRTFTGIHRRIRAGWHGSALLPDFCGSSIDFGVHGARSERQLLDCPPR